MYIYMYIYVYIYVYIYIYMIIFSDHRRILRTSLQQGNFEI